MPEKNQDLPAMEGEGVAPKKIKAVDEAFDELLGHRQRRMNAGEKEQACSDLLTGLFHKHNLRSYVYDDVRYVIKGKEKIVRAPKDEALNGDGE